MINTNKHITVFDVDETLVVTKSKIRIQNHSTGFYAELAPYEFNNFNQQANDEIDFSDFRCLDILKDGSIIEWVFAILKKTIFNGNDVAIITARDDAKLIYDFLSHHNLKINPSYIFAVNDPLSEFSGSIAQRKRGAFIKLIEKGYDKFTFFDDDEKNIDIAKKLEIEFPDIIMNTHLIETS